MAGIFSLSLSAQAARSPATYFQLKSELNKISKKDLVEKVNGLVRASSPSRMVGNPGHAKAFSWLESEIKKLDPKKTGKLTVSEFTPDLAEVKRFYQADFVNKVEGKIPKHSGDYQRWAQFIKHMENTANGLKDVKGKNLIWEKSGLDSSKVLVVTAHYDTISHDPSSMMIRQNDPMPGANYNASGVAVALGLIQTLARFDLNYSVQIVLLDWQGVGFLGSFEHAKALKASGKNVLGVINLEMLGQDTTYFDKSKKLGNMKAYTREEQKDVKWLEGLLKHGPKITTKVEFEGVGNGFENSDNFRYWEQGFRAATFTQNWEEDFNPKFFQTPKDTPETLNHRTLWNSYLYIGGIVGGTLLDITK